MTDHEPDYEERDHPLFGRAPEPGGRHAAPGSEEDGNVAPDAVTGAAGETNAGSPSTIERLNVPVQSGRHRGEDKPEESEVWGHGRARSWKGRIAGLVALLVVVALVVVVATVGVGFVKKHLHHDSSSDYSGADAHGSVMVQVHQGDTATDIARTLQAAGVVESVGAFVDAARADPQSTGIQVGYYQLQLEMSSSAVLAVLVNPHNLVGTPVTVTEGARVNDVITAITKHTKITKAQVVAALKDTAALGLPAAANGNPEGYLFPATYTVIPGETATQLLQQMVAKAVSEDAALGVDTDAAKVGLTPGQVITVASILEYEARRPQDYPKVARAIYNRLKIGMPIQSDATVSYANGVSGEIWTTPTQRANGSPYNTYAHKGLPPGPIGSPGATTIKAALNPTAGPWLYWVVVNLQTGKTVFSTTLAQHNAAVQQFRNYCATQSASHCQ